MGDLSQYAPADFGGAPEDITGDNGEFIFRNITLDWRNPIAWMGKRPSWPSDENVRCKGFYAIIRNHGRQTQRNIISYIGIARSLYGRLDINKHGTANDLVGRKGETRLAYAVVKGKGQHTFSKLQEIEDILIWAHWATIENKCSLNTMPSMRLSSGKGAKRSRPWIITNEGYDFEGKMPKKIVYPWMLVSKG